jgi:hypothetical protein
MRNKKGWVVEGVGYIPLTQNQVAKVDPSLVSLLESSTWHAQYVPHMKAYYACSTIVRDGKHKRVYMHRLILEHIKGSVDVCDHHSGDTLDNRSANLRDVTYSQNAANRKRRKTSISHYKGVSFKAKKWEAAIMVEGVYKYLGRFESESEAAEAYLEASRKFFGEYAYAQSV